MYAIIQYCIFIFAWYEIVVYWFFITAHRECVLIKWRDEWWNAYGLSITESEVLSTFKDTNAAHQTGTFQKGRRCSSKNICFTAQNNSANTFPNQHLLKEIK